MVKISGAMSAFGEPNADSPASLPYCGADAANEELLPEPSQDAMRLAELEQENRDLRHQLKCLQSALVSAAGLLQPYVIRLNGRG